MNKKSESWLSKLKSGLGRSSEQLTGKISKILSRKKLDAQMVEELEDALIAADLGVPTASRLSSSLSEKTFDNEISDEEVRQILSDNIAKILKPIATPLKIDKNLKPHVILVVGVNGSGKTTTIGKLAKLWAQNGKKVLLAAGDTFRAAAVEQLAIWGERAGCDVISDDTGADPAGLAYKALEQAKVLGVDVLLIDTAGRLQNREDLMGELSKVIRVLRKLDPDAPHTCLQVLDATVGQNAHSQVENFKDITNVNGLVMTKLDGTARGGVVVALAERFGLPMYALGVGEGEEDLQPFDADAFAKNLLGLDL
ncbi:MAG: signal recognition particle-docking protein FtsY [Rhodospirillaceae bacterium]|nr:signal recognition particle-docking protein FtsY [Rhodospirillaceae bacterium]|tara:strand:+ start:288 stop:1220 length:933 start_codon:yes stop_codon:yes gene_type:complete